MTSRTDTTMPDDQLPTDPDVQVGGPARTMRPVHCGGATSASSRSAARSAPRSATRSAPRSPHTTG